MPDTLHRTYHDEEIVNVNGFNTFAGSAFGLPNGTRPGGILTTPGNIGQHPRSLPGRPVYAERGAWANDFG